MKLRKGLSVLTLAALAACTGAQVEKATSDSTIPSFSADRIEADVTFLADDLLRGRDTGSEGYRIAANYVAAEYARLGLKPAGTDGSYFQEVPFQKAKLNQETATMSLTIGGDEKALTLGDDYYVGGDVRAPAGDQTGDIVFAGYGIYAPELGHDDLEGLDLDGKIVLVISGAPTTFQTEIRAHHGSSTTKKAELAKRGAVGYITVNSLSNEKRRPFSRLKKYLDYETFDWVMPATESEGAPVIAASASISHDVAKTIFTAAGKSFEEVMNEAEVGAPEGFDTAVKAHIKLESVLSEVFYSPNVLGVIEGSDPTLKDEYVVLSAHLDHIGESLHPKGDDKVNNGAIDNATGVAVMMDVARAYARADVKPRRSILFAAVVAEEKGLLGAEYFAHFPTVEKSSLVANVNLDMPILLYDFSDVVAFGADRSSLGPVTDKALAEIGLSLSPDPMPEEGIFTRSDHYRFVQQGIPSVFLVTGWGKTTLGEDGGAIFREFLGKTYHSPHDDLTQAINYEAGAKFAKVNWLIVNAVANADERPTWNDGDFFGQTFSK
ncbi:M28 family metallopeptidase [Kordiimonas aestuarii]|uniref:M28 family metallopeptidase n=1 Tax=Kordiimonas aestuarii TaxID=1005925 RepID=UPI0021CF2BE4|nr:M28 family metallopeptidase [Kordiimonas aestuarii]